MFKVCFVKLFVNRYDYFFSNLDDINVGTHNYKTLELCDNALTELFKKYTKTETGETFEMKLDSLNNKYSLFKTELGYIVRYVYLF